MDRGPEKNRKTQRAYSLNIKQEGEPKKRERNTIEKVTVFLASVYYNISKVLIIAVTLIAVWVLSTNYNVFPVIEKIFVREEGSVAVKETLMEIDGLNLNKDVLKEEDFKTIKTKIDSEIAPILLEQKIFDEGRTAFNSEMKQFYSREYADKVVISDVLYSALSKIYSSEYRYPESVTLVSIGSVMKDKKPISKAVVDINAVDDDSGFHVTSVEMFFDKEYKIDHVSILSENEDYENTRTPLDVEYSLVTNSNTTIMVREVNKFVKDINNKALYDKLQMSPIDITNTQLKSFLSNLDIENKNYEVLSELFKLIKGNSNNFGIIEYSHTDFNVNPITDIVIGVQTTEMTYKYNLKFNRNSESLVSISRI